MDEDLKKILSKTADTIRQLSMEAVQKANSGHPGLPMGCAELGAYLYGYLLKHYPKNPKWVNRDRLVLSAGHGSMWLYSCMHLSGFALPLDEIMRFRQLHSRTPGHPESHETVGVEATTGPLGQGVGNAVGQALGFKILSAKFNRPQHKIFTNKIYCLAGDGCMQEGVSHEACSLAGHLSLDNLVLIYDANQITLDGPLYQSCSEDTKARFLAYGWDVYEMNGNDLGEIDKVMQAVKREQKKPTLILSHTVIGKGSPHKEGTFHVHGSPLGEEEVAATKKALGLPEEKFYIPQSVRTFFETKLAKDEEGEKKWNELFKRWKEAFPELAKEFHAMQEKSIPQDLEEELKKCDIKSPIAGRSASQEVLASLGTSLPFLYGGSADLSVSDCTMMQKYPVIEPHHFIGRNIKFGIREFGMATAAAGLWQTGMMIPYIGTFLTFSDYMRNAIRLAALSGYHIIYQFTHDSVFLGEDGPTHQPIEHLAALRAIPHLHVLRPADANEVKGAWIAALTYEGPSAIILSRQKLPSLKGAQVSYQDGVGRGAYIVKREMAKPDFTLLATGSEVSLAIEVASALEKLGKQVRVVSMPCWEMFQVQSEAYREAILGGDIGKRVSIEAATGFGWERWVGREGIVICMEDFGLSAPLADLAQEFGFTVDAILDRLLSHS